MCSLIGWKKQLVQTSCILKKMISVLRIDIDRNRADAYEIVANGTMPDRKLPSVRRHGIAVRETDPTGRLPSPDRGREPEPKNRHGYDPAIR